MSIIIGLAGKAGSGKDTFAERLVEKHGFTRLAFADPLKEILRRMDPIIRVYGEGDCAMVSDFTDADVNVKVFSEYRRLLQALGTACREVIDQEVWVEVLENAVFDAEGQGQTRLVITDVRMVNEAEWVQHSRWMEPGLLLRIVRPGAGLNGSAASHRSEWDLDDENINEVLNDGTIEDLHVKADLIVEALLQKEGV